MKAELYKIKKIWKQTDKSMPYEQFKNEMLPLMRPYITQNDLCNARDIVHDRDLEQAMAFGGAYRKTGNVNAAKSGL